MRDQDTFVQADQTLQGVIDQIRDHQWSMSIAPVFAGNTAVTTLHDFVRHQAYDEAWVPALLAGKTIDEVGATIYDGDLLGADPKGSYDRIAADARPVSGCG